MTDKLNEMVQYPDNQENTIPDVMMFANHNQCDLGLDIVILTSIGF